MEETELISRLQTEETKHAAFRQLVHHYKEKIYWHVRRMLHSHEDANDVVQNVFIKIFKGIENFSGKSKLYTWIYRISTNECLTFIEKSKKTQPNFTEIPVERNIQAARELP